MPTTTKFIMGSLATVGLAGGGLLAFKSGKLQGLMHSAISSAGKYRRGKLVAANESLRRFSEEEGLGNFGKAIGAAMKGDTKESRRQLDTFFDAVTSAGEHFTNGMTEHENRMKSLQGRSLIDTEVHAQKLFANQNGALEDLAKQGVDPKHLEFAQHKMEEHRVKFGKLDSKEEEMMMKRTGFRHATIGDLINAKEISESDSFVRSGKKMYERITGEAGDFLKTRADKNIMIDMDGNIADLRDFRKTFLGFIESVSTDFTIPLIKINPLRMFYADQLFGTLEKPTYHVFDFHQRNPLVTGHNGATEATMMYVDGLVYKLPHTAAEKAENVSGNYFLADAQKGPIARLIRNVSGVSISQFNKPEANAPFWKRARYSIQSKLGLGFQDEPQGQFDLLDMTSWGAAPMNAITGRLRYNDQNAPREWLKESFGVNANYILMRKAKDIREVGAKEWMGQLKAGRNNLQDFTFASLFPYSFFERLNATLNQVNLGLPNADLGSAMSIFQNLMLKRVAPIWVGYELWNYVNYESENLTGEQFSDRFAKAYANSSVEIAGLRDKLGVTDWAKGVKPLLVGGEQLASFPVIGKFLDLDSNKEETEDFWENGEVEVRKGRWWPLGNTPYSGSKIDYFQPNWVRRVLADAKFSDSQYGSREEYFQNSWMPTPRHPFAPIRHFITDPYHYEKKHYDDRPYMVTGGISEFENFPLVGPVLNQTVGQVLKPQRRMHTEYWNEQPIEVTDQVTPAGFGGMPPITPELAGEIQRQMAPIPGGSGTGGVTVKQPIDHEENKAIAAYVTSSGQVQIVTTDDPQNIWDARKSLSTVSPSHSSDFVVERLREPEDDIPLEEPEFTGAMHQAIGDLHYNASEMGGFYGFMGTSITGEVAATAPVWQASSEMSSYSRAFWDMDIGGYGGDANEIFRRFLPKDRKLQEVNPIRNRMPTWVPGGDYFIDYQHGDPYVKVKKGELRLPGEAYERAYGIDSDKMMKMEIGASFIGYDDEKVRDHILKRDVVKDEALQRVLDFGTGWHKQWEREMKNLGVAESMEQYVKDEKAGIGGFYDLYGKQDNLLDWLFSQAKEFTYYQPVDSGGDETFKGFFKKGQKININDERTREAFRAFAKEQGEYGLIDPKTRSPKVWENDEMHWENVQQVNFYAGQKHTGINYLIHVDRENPDRGIKVFAFGYNPVLDRYSRSKIENIRQGIRNDMAEGKVARGDLYDPIDRYRILADVAPYSREFRDMTSDLKWINFSDEEKKEIQTIKKQVSQRKERLRLYPYRFTTANLENQTVTVDQVIDQNTFTTKEHPDNPIRLAGLRVPTGKDDPVALRAQEVIAHTIRPGKRVKIAYDADENNRIKSDTYKTIQSVVYDSHGRNLNNYLLQQDLAKEKENDWSPAAVHGRFTDKQIAFGSLWEKFAHMDTILHTKFLQVRSPLESYERREVYGKDWQEWTDPVQDYLIPGIQNGMNHHPLYAIAAGGIMGAMFGSLKAGDLGHDGTRVMARYGKIVGGVMGASVMGTAVMYKALKEHLTGEAWIPERRKKERDTEEYFDILKYIKYNSLYQEYAQRALKQEHFDVDKYLADEKKDGEWRKKRMNDLERIKRQIYGSHQNDWPQIQKTLKEMGIDAPDRATATKMLNKEINELTVHRELRPITPLAARAVLYKQQTKKTMYGYEQGDPMADVLAAIPKKDRDYVLPFIESPEEERGRILEVAPNYMKRILQSAWGMKVDDREDLKEYFKKHPLPGKKWKGWNEGTSLDDIKVKFVDRVGLDPSEFDIWPADKQRAAMLDAGTPNVFNGRETAESYAGKLRDILHGKGLDDIDVQIVESNKEGIHVDLDMEHDRRDEFKKLVNNQGQYVM